MAGEKRTFGTISRLSSGRYQAKYVGPDGIRHAAPQTFDDKETARLWLAKERRLTETPEEWQPPKVRAASAFAKPLSFGEFAESWLINRKTKGRPLADRTREHYRSLLDAYILPTFEDVPLTSIAPEDIDHWYELVAIGKETTRAHAYSLLRTILATAVDRRLIKLANPAKVRGGGSTNRAKQVRPATLSELETITAAMPERQQLMVLLASWCALRFGELAELRRGDVDTKNGVLRIRRGVVRTKEGAKVKAPKTDAGTRDVSIPPPLLPAVREHLLEHTAPGKDGLLFPSAMGGHLQPSTFYGKATVYRRDGEVSRKGYGWYAARQASGRDDLRFHDLRHTGATLAAQTGATLGELMTRLGHSTPAAALRYQHAAAERDKEIARRLGEMMGGSSSSN